MDATILYEMLRCLVCMVLACWLIQKTLHVPGYPALYAVTVAVVCLFLGDVYWLAHLMIRGSTPVILSACDAAYLGFWLILNAGGFPVRRGRRNQARPLRRSWGFLSC